MSEDLLTADLVDVAKPADDDLRMWSVTTIIGCLDKPALMYWAAGLTADAAIAQADYLAARIEHEGREKVWKDLRDARFSRPKGQRSATELGTAVHDACERYALTGVKPEVDAEVQPFLDQFDAWVQKWQPVYEAAEMTVYSPTYGYAGTLDAIMVVDGMRVICDLKTSRQSVDNYGKERGPYPEVALQLAAYRYAELAATWRARRYEYRKRRYYLLGDSEQTESVPVPKVDGGIAIHISPEHATAYPIKCGEDVHTAFLYIIEAARWSFEMSKTVIGDPLVHPSEALV